MDSLDLERDLIDLKFGINNRLTADIIRQADFYKSNVTLIRGHFAIEDDDCQTMGYECACAVAMVYMAYMKPKRPGRKFEDSYSAVSHAQAAVQTNLYLMGFVHAWDGQSREPIEGAEYDAGYVDGDLAVKDFAWAKSYRRGGAHVRR